MKTQRQLNVEHLNLIGSSPSIECSGARQPGAIVHEISLPGNTSIVRPLKLSRVSHIPLDSLYSAHDTGVLASGSTVFLSTYVGTGSWITAFSDEGGTDYEPYRILEFTMPSDGGDGTYDDGVIIIEGYDVYGAAVTEHIPIIPSGGGVSSIRPYSSITRIFIPDTNEASLDIGVANVFWVPYLESVSDIMEVRVKTSGDTGYEIDEDAVSGSDFTDTLATLDSPLASVATKLLRSDLTYVTGSDIFPFSDTFGHAEIEVVSGDSEIGEIIGVYKDVSDTTLLIERGLYGTTPRNIEAGTKLLRRATKTVTLTGVVDANRYEIVYKSRVI